MDYYYAIDPDVDASGLAELHRPTKKLQLCNKSFTDMLDALTAIKRERLRDGASYIVLVEDSWRSTANWHLDPRKSVNHAAALGESVGRCHQVGILLLEWCKAHGIPAKGVQPLPLKVGKTHLWQGADGKITHDEFCSLTNYPVKRTNQEQRDAGLLAWNAAKLPMRIAPNLKRWSYI